jgi:tetratricopeptide (TPR) repeat protein
MDEEATGLVELATAVVAARAAVEIGVKGAEERMTEAYTRLVERQLAEGLADDALETAQELVAHRRSAGDTSVEGLLRHEEALALLESALPRHADLRLRTAGLRQQAQVREQLAQRDPAQATSAAVTMLELATVLREQGEHREVRTVAARAAELAAGVPDELDRTFLETEAHLLRALALVASRRRRNRLDAVAAAVRAVELTRSERTLWTLATVRHTLGQGAEALSAVDEALTLPARSRDPEVHADLLRLREELTGRAAS